MEYENIHNRIIGLKQAEFSKSIVSIIENMVDPNEVNRRNISKIYQAIKSGTPIGFGDAPSQ